MQREIQEVQPAVKLLRMVLSGETVNASAGRWNFSNFNNPQTIIAIFENGSAIYQFSVGIKDKDVTFYNTHREAEQGFGTPSLQSCEEILRLLSENDQKRIRLVFPSFDQQDTIKWLLKNGYKTEDGKEFYKDMF